jgi:hypothetical protein
MAKKKAPKPKSEPWGESKPLAAQLRGSAEWKAWLEEFARSNRLSVAGVIDMALTRLAKDLGFRERRSVERGRVGLRLDPD